MFDVNITINDVLHPGAAQQSAAFSLYFFCDQQHRCQQQQLSDKTAHSTSASQHLQNGSRAALCVFHKINTHLQRPLFSQERIKLRWSNTTVRSLCSRPHDDFHHERLSSRNDAKWHANSELVDASTRKKNDAEKEGRSVCADQKASSTSYGS